MHRRQGRLDAEPGRVPVRAGRQEPELVQAQPEPVPEPRVPEPVRVRARAGRRVPARVQRVLVRVQRVPGPERAPPVLVRVQRVPAPERVPGPVRVPQVPAQRVPVRAQASELRVLAQALEPAVRWALEPVQVRKEPHPARPGNRRPLSGSRRYRY